MNNHAISFDYPENSTIPELFEAFVAAHPDAPAVVFGDRTLSYAELNERANRTARTIRRLHRLQYDRELVPDTPIGIYINQGPNMIVGLLAILKAGGAYLPLDPAYPESRLKGMMEDAQLPIIITEQTLVEQLLFLDDCDYGVICLDGGWDWIAEQSCENLSPIAGPRSLAYVLYTSGSTGRPKGVMVEHRSVIHLVRNQNYIEVRSSDCLAQTASISFDAATFEVWGALLTGARLAIIDRSELLSGVRLAAAQRRHGVTIEFFTTAVFNLLAEGDAEALLGLRVAIFGGEEANAVKVAQVLAHKSPGLTLCNAYGPTECTSFSTICHLSDTDSPLSVIPIGVPLARMYAYVLDEHLQPVPAEVMGELYLGGDGVARGYLNRPELTAEHFIPNPFVTDQQRALGKNLVLYKTGDFVKQSQSGQLIYLERADDQIKIRGFRVELGEIETRLQAHPDVKDCVVLPYGDYHQKRLIAYVIPMRPGGLDPRDLSVHLAAALPAFMVPSVFMEIASFPLNPNGKIDRRALPPPFVAGTETTASCLSKQCWKSTPAEPRNELECTIHDLVAAALNMPALGIDDNIFHFGAHSLIVAQICAAIRSRLRTTLDPKEVFEHPTVAGISRLVADRQAMGADDEAAIPKAPRDQPIPLTYQQEQIWFLSKLAPDNRAYNSQFSVRLRGPLDPNVLRRCLQEIVCRHEILRTTFHERNGVPVQVIHDPWPVELPEIDLRHLPAQRREQEVERCIGEELNHSFDYARLPLFRSRIYCLDQDDWLLLHIEHHFIHDGWEIMVFLQEIKTLYVAFVDGRGSPLAPLPIQYADYAVWQRKMLIGTRLDEKVRYWIDKIRDYPHVLNLYTDRPRPAVQGFRGDNLRFNLDPELYQALRAFSVSHQVTLFMTMYAVFAVLLSRYSDQEKLLVGTGVANRDMKETEGLLGMFVNIVLLCADLSGRATFTEFLERTRQGILEDIKHHDTPFPAIVERLKAGHKSDRNPLFQVIFAFHDSAVPVLDFAGVRSTILERHNQTAKTDMNLICIPRAEQHVAMGAAAPPVEDLTLIWEYNTDLFERGTIERMTSHYVALLREIVRDPGRRVSDLAMIDDVEAAELLAFGVGVRVPYPVEKTLPRLFEEQAHRHPDKTAVIHRGQGLSYAELNARANRLARQLRQTDQARLGRHLEAGACVGLCVTRGIDMVVGMLAILKAGAAYAPLSPDYPENRLRFMLNDADIKVVLTQTDIAARVPLLLQGDLVLIGIDAARNSGAQQSADDLDAFSGATDTAFVIYTSGSTGVPKGVAVPHRAAHNLVLAATAKRCSESDIFAQMADYAFDAATFEIWGALVTGATVAIIDSDTVLNPERLLATMGENGTTVAFFTTALFNLLTETKPEVVTRLRCVQFGGEMANAACVSKVLQCKGPQTALMQVYGPTECTTYSTLYELTDQDAGRDIMPIGRPLANYTTYVLDENRRLVPVGVPGELYIGGDGVAIGYLNRPELTAERFVPNPFTTPEDRERGANLVMYKTGDRVRWLADGTLHILGRIDFQVKVRGFRIEPEEVEKALLTHPGVRQCIVVPWEGNLIAYWVPGGPPGAVSQGELKSHLMTQLPDYMVPSAFLETERFELNRNGKIDRTRLLAPGIALVMAKKGEQVAPRTETERRLVAIWQDLLRIGSVGVQDSFFELGGNSILTVRMLDLVKQTFGAEINVASLFSRPTIAAMAARIDRSGPDEVVGDDNLTLALKDAQEDLPVIAGTPATPGDPQGILLTGVTGFLGFHLLDKFLSLTSARIYCLVRGVDDDAALARFGDTLRFYGHPELAGHPRIVLVRGDLGKPNLGLEPPLIHEFDERVDHIMHCGAFVHHMFDYRTVRGENVGSVVELLKIAAHGRPKVFHFISTLSVASRRDHVGRIVEVEIGDCPISSNGYVMSKWAAECILQRHAKKGLMVNIFRPGNITGHSLTGVCSPEKNHALLLVKGCLQMKCAPDWQRPIEMTPVDVLAEAIVRLSLDTAGGGVFNMNNPVQIDWAEYMDVLGTLGLGCELVSVDVWRQRLEGIGEKNALYPLREIYLKAREDLIDPEGHAIAARDSSMTQDALHRLGVFYPCDYLPYLRTLVHYLQTSGFFPTATQRGSDHATS